MNIDYQNFIFDDIKSNSNNLKRAKAKVLSVEEDNTSALVETIGDGIRIVLYNKTNELISIGDIVTVEYSKFLSSKTGYIILRNGKPKFMK